MRSLAMMFLMTALAGAVPTIDFNLIGVGDTPRDYFNAGYSGSLAGPGIPYHTRIRGAFLDPLVVDNESAGVSVVEEIGERSLSILHSPVVFELGKPTTKFYYLMNSHFYDRNNPAWIFAYNADGEIVGMAPLEQTNTGMRDPRCKPETVLCNWTSQMFILLVEFVRVEFWVNWSHQVYIQRIWWEGMDQPGGSMWFGSDVEPQPTQVRWRDPEEE